MSVDWNDIHVTAGLEAVRDQLRAGLQAANESPSPSIDDGPPWQDDELPPPAPPETEGRIELAEAIERFWLVMPDGKVWDGRDKHLLKKTAAKDLMGKALFDEWIDHPDRRKTTLDTVKPLAASAAAKGGGGLAAALDRYVYIYPTSDAWDLRLRQTVPLSALRFAIADCFDDWVKHPGRREIDTDKVVFDPTQRCDPTLTINKFTGLPLTPKRDDTKCVAIINLVWHLCNGDKTDIEWLLRWLAYPLQHVGAKMATAVLFHSPTEGTGKSLLFDGVVREIYGQYGSTVGQHQLESQYSEWRSGLLFALFEEIFSRDQKYNYTGTLKHMVSGKTQRIEKKFVSSWEEANHMNAVFLSNELQPYPIDSSDRRNFVVYPRTTLPEPQQKAVQHEIENGGIEAFYAYLLAVDLGDFNPHTKPPMSPAKLNLINFGRPSWEVFYHEWLAGELWLPVVPCLTIDLFSAYRSWADKRRENVVSHHKFAAFAAKVEAVTKRNDVRYSDGYKESKGKLFVPRGCEPDPGETQSIYYGRCVELFKKALDAGE